MTGESARARIDPATLDQLAADLAAVCAPKDVRRDEAMSRHTTWRVGGPADLYVVARSADQLAGVLARCLEADVPVYVMGAGSNSLVSDRGVRGVVIANRATAVSFDAATGQVTAESGAPIAGLARQAAEQGLSGLEWAAAVPGSVGAAVFGNAGAHGGDMKSVLRAVEVYDAGQVQRRLEPAELDLNYRTTRLNTSARRGEPRRRFILRATLGLTPDDPAAINERLRGFVEHRRATQPFESSAGSVFKNPPGDAAGRLLDQAGLKGTRVGGAMISPKHANFIINAENATAADVMGLVALARNRVREQFGIELEMEVLRLGDWDKPA